ncbi:GGDEF domain-containing protein [Mesorhizobium sp. LHD-90]|uniref:GGDEF domain-containing protein n=1 Tax=Mesorhizobium sp. LHD-90 TaxID=3071414 RepID=UPI0027E1E604|nr:GGDEF domain-containing protein [Mesorhizobium sp. LHD-90]MDQ6434880.1 GGDEF domain-containing protein [Mesorhizobium sp. LHD-90]
MTLDYNSLLIALGFSGACLAATLLMSWLVARTELFLLTWAAGVVLIVFYVVLYAFYVDDPSPLLGAVCYIALLTGLSALLGAARQFRTGRSPLKPAMIGGCVLIALAVPPILMGYDGLGFMAENIAAAALLSATAYEYWRGRAEAPGPILGLSVLYGVVAFGFVLCAGVLIWDGKLVLGQAPQNWAEDVSLAVNIAGMTGIGALSLALNHWRAAGKHRNEARTDSLTGLLNRRAVFDLHSPVPMRQFSAVIAFDLDDFKSINDRFGHAAGDSVIRSFAEELSKAAGRADSAARLGGEEFVLVVSRTLPERAEQLAERIRANFAARQIDTDQGILACTVSAGIAFGTEAGASFESVLRLADKALYSAKSKGRNQVAMRHVRLVK